MEKNETRQKIAKKEEARKVQLAEKLLEAEIYRCENMDTKVFSIREAVAALARTENLILRLALGDSW